MPGHSSDTDMVPAVSVLSLDQTKNTPGAAAAAGGRGAIYGNRRSRRKKHRSGVGEKEQKKHNTKQSETNRNDTRLLFFRWSAGGFDLSDQYQSD